MELTKRKYKKAEVSCIIDEITKDYNEKIRRLKDEIAELSSCNEKLNAQLNFSNREEAVVVDVLKDAKRSSEELYRSSLEKYNACVLSLKSFSVKWKKYFEYINEKYPYYPSLKQAQDLNNLLNEILGSEADSEIAVEKLKVSLEKNVSKKTAFNPNALIEDYIVATGENGFNLNDVLYPGELKLEELCKELGLMDEEK